LALIKAKPAGDPGLTAFFRAASDFLIIPAGSAEAPSVGGLASSSWSHWNATFHKCAFNIYIYIYNIEKYGAYAIVYTYIYIYTYIIHVYITYISLCMYVHIFTQHLDAHQIDS